MLVMMAILLIFVDISTENFDRCCWMYSMKAVDLGAHRPIL